MASEIIRYQAGSQSSPNPNGYDEATNPLHPAQRIANRFSHFTDGVYDLSAESHLSKLLKALMGDAGAGQLHKRMLLARLQQSLSSTHFFDLDAFYGALLNVYRRSDEQLAKNPLLETVSATEWDTLRLQDSSYRSRAEQFAKALNLGSTAIGLEVAAEAILGVNCDVRESWAVDDSIRSIYADIQALGTTYAVLEGYSYAQLESIGGRIGASAPLKERHKITVYPHRAITQEERYDVLRVLERLKPAGSLIDVSPTPQQVLVPVPVTNAAADSEHWEVRSLIANSTVNDVSLYPNSAAGFIPKPFSPWSSYQGEAWTLLTEGPAAVAYSVPGSPSLTQKFDPTGVDLPSQQSKVGSDSLTFLPQYALRPIRSIMAGRLMSEGILSANPMSGVRDAELFSTTGTLLIDGASASQLELAAPLKDGSNREGKLFWTSPIRDWFDPTADVVETRFSSPQRVNSVSLEVSHYPHVLEVQAWDDQAGNWVVLLTNTVRDSSPHSVTGDLPAGAVHPYHIGDSHWVKMTQRVPPILTSMIRFVIHRFGEKGSAEGLVSIPERPDAIWVSSQFPGGMPTRPDIIAAVQAQNWSGVPDVSVSGMPSNLATGNRSVDAMAEAVCRPPLGYGGRFVRYPVGLRNIDIGFRLTSAYDSPKSLVDQNEPVAVTRNAAGQAVRHYLARNPASNVLDGLRTTFWRSEPMPIADAVVCLYLDTRNTAGQPQVIDSFDIDPLTTGPTVNIYWAPTLQGVDFTASRPSESALSPSQVIGSFPSISADYGLSFPPSDVSFIDLASDSLRWEPMVSPWWIGVSFNSSLASNQYNDSVILGAGTSSSGGPTGLGEVNLHLDSDLIRFCVGNVEASLAVSFPVGATVSVVAACVPSSAGTVTLTLKVKVGVNAVQSSVVSGSLSTVLSVPSFVRFGHGVMDSVTKTAAGIRLQAANLTYGAEYSDYFIDPTQSARRIDATDRFSELGSDANSPIAGALLRFLPAHISTKVDQTGSLANKYGFIGGQPDIYDQVSWVPIARDYALKRGVIRVPPTSAALWKFEFSSLIAEPYETLFSIQRRVKIMPDSLAVPTKDSGAVMASAATAALAVNSVGRHIDTPVIQSYFSPWEGGFSPASGFVARDAGLSQQASKSLGFGFNLMPWQPSPLTAMFASVGQHSYTYQWIEHSNKVAFFVGLRSLTPLRTDYSANDNTQTYVDDFWDMYSVEANTMQFTSGAFFTTSGPQSILLGTPQTVTGKMLGSIASVEAVQFATQQSEAAQLLADDTFKSPSLSSYGFDSIDSWQQDGDATVYYDSGLKGVRVGRDPDARLLSSPPLDALNRQITDPVLTTRLSVTPNMVTASFGGLKSSAVTVSPRGMLHVACRVMAQAPLSAPLTLQIVGSDGTTVLRESSFTPVANVVTEHSLSYIIGSSLGLDGVVTARIIQKGVYRDSWLVYALSLFDDGYLWEFSVDNGASWVPAYDVRNNQAGVLRFPRPGGGLKWRFTAYRRNIVLSALKIKPWYEGRALGRQAFPQRGPNISAYDDAVPIQDDPDFVAWTNPIPQRWFAQYAKTFTIETETLFGSSTFARSYSRTVEESIGTPGELGTRGSFGALRGGDEALSVSDGTTTSLALIRSASDTATVSDTASPLLFSDGIVHPIVAPPTGG